MFDQMNEVPQGPKVVTLVSDELLAFEYGIAYEVFGLPRPEFESDWYSFRTCTPNPGLVRASGGFSASIDLGLESLEDADTVLIPGWPDIERPVRQNVIDALLAAHARGARLASLCSGVVVLAQTGLLDGCKATTHWRFIESISQRFSQIDFDPDVLYVDQGRILTAAGSAAGMDLCLHMVRGDYGMEKANYVARGLVMPPHREGGQSQFIPQPVPKDYEASRIGAVIEKMQRSLATNMAVKDLAGEAGMSLRTFQRRFEAMTGLPPSAWVLQERLRLACHLLESEQNMRLEDVALQCGFGTVPTMRHHFRQKMNTSPSRYKKTFAPEKLEAVARAQEDSYRPNHIC